MTLRRICSALPFLVPPLALAVVIWLQPADHLDHERRPDRAPWLGRLVYDDWDWSAIVLRGLNASRGRTPGLDREPTLTAEEFAEGLHDTNRPLQERYYLEYPLLATWIFRLPFLVHPVSAPAVILDGHYGNILFHEPRDKGERDLWQSLRLAMQTYAALMMICLLLLMAIVRRGYEPGGGLAGVVWLFLLPGALYFTLNRFDVVPALLTAASFACLGRRRLLASALFLATATMVKVYPILLAPIIVRYLFDHRRNAVIWAAAFTAGCLVLLLFPLLWTDWQAISGPYRVQLTREPMGATLYVDALPKALAANDWLGRGFRFGTLGLVMLALVARRPPNLESVLRRGTIGLIMFAALSVFFSPQWILWFSPLLVPLAGRRWSMLLLVVGLDITTYLTVPVAMDADYRNWNLSEEMLTTIDHAWPVLSAIVNTTRTVLLGMIVVALAWTELRHPAEKITRYREQLA
jgi:hypothetical protein